MRTFVGLLMAGTLLAQPRLNLNNIDLEAIDRGARPCEDFYQHAIGEWHKKNPIPATQVRWGKRWAAADANLETLHQIVKEIAARPGKPGTNEQLIGDLYKTCMDTAAIDAQGAKPIQPHLKRIRRIGDRKQLVAEISRLATEGASVPVRLFPRPYSEQPKLMVAGIGPSGLGLPDRDYYLKTDAKSQETRKRYLGHVSAMFRLAGSSQDRADAASRTILAMETKMAEASLTRVERRDPYKVNNHLEVAKLGELTPHFNWQAYYRTAGLRFDGVVTVSDLKFMKEFDRQLAETSLDDWKTYLEWHVLRLAGDELSREFRDEIFGFRRAYLAGAKEQQPRWKTCVERVDELLGEALGKAYVGKVFPPAAKAKMQEMVKNLSGAMEESIKDVPWMTEATRQEALAKLATFDPQVGYPDAWRGYAGLRMDRKSHWANVERAEAFNRRDDLSQIGKPVDRNRWGMTTPTSNAYYSPLQNGIVFPAGILVPPMFSLQADDAVNYGAIGVVIGHEISHGYDDSGSQYDADGRLKNWWTPDDRKRFMEKAACVVEQFDNYSIEDGVRHNGKLVLGESIGDLAGARIAYRAYMKSLEGKPKPPVVDGSTPEQRFFLAWGQSRGDSTRIETQRLMVVTDPHPVAKFRVIGPLANMPEFQQAFGCKPGDAMVRPPEKQCRVW